MNWVFVRFRFRDVLVMIRFRAKVRIRLQKLIKNEWKSMKSPCEDGKI